MKPIYIHTYSRSEADTKHEIAMAFINQNFEESSDALIANSLMQDADTYYINKFNTLTNQSLDYESIVDSWGLQGDGWLAITIRSNFIISASDDEHHLLYVLHNDTLATQLKLILL